LILRKISKFDATRCQILRLKYANLIFAGGAYSAPPDPLAVFKGLASKGRKAKPASPKYFGLELPLEMPRHYYHCLLRRSSTIYKENRHEIYSCNPVSSPRGAYRAKPGMSPSNLHGGIRTLI